MLLLLWLVAAVGTIMGSLNNPLLTIYLETHGRATILAVLSEEFKKLDGRRGPLSQALNDRACMEYANIKYFLRQLTLTSREYEASECRTNLNSNFKSVLSPKKDTHLRVHELTPLDLDLGRAVLEYSKNLPSLEGSEFHRFNDLNYRLQCLVDYQQLVQVMLVERGVEATFERVVSIPPVCGFQKAQLDFGGKIVDSHVLYVPFNGSLECRVGKSSTCSRSIAEHRGARYKIFDETV